MIQSEFDNTESYVLTPGRYERDASDLGGNLALIRTFGRLGTFRQLNHRGTLAGAQGSTERPCRWLRGWLDQFWDQALRHRAFKSEPPIRYRLIP
jgi:hypothetical protein